MLFAIDNCEKILAGRKTQTRRVVKEREGLLFCRADSESEYNIATVVSYPAPFGPLRGTGYRIKWQVGSSYAIQPGRGKASLGRFLLTDIRKERLQEISKEDAVAEGVLALETPFGGEAYTAFDDHEVVWVTAAGAFFAYWDTIHKPGERWEDDPSCWVLTMEVSDDLQS